MNTEACDRGYHGSCLKDWCGCMCHPRKGDTRASWMRVLYRRIKGKS